MARLVLSNRLSGKIELTDGFPFDSPTFVVDSPPFGGSCSVNPAEGTALETPFEISSTDWTDDDIPLMYCFLWLGDSDIIKRIGSLDTALLTSRVRYGKVKCQTDPSQEPSVNGLMLGSNVIR